MMAGGWLFGHESTGPLTVANSINFGNTAVREGPDAYRLYFGAAATLTNCLLGSAAAGGVLTTTNVVIGKPALCEHDGRGCKLSTTLENSPAIDAGNNSLIPAGVTTDLSGNARIQDGKGDNTATVDLGAYERGVPLPTIYVSATAVGENNGSSWANAYTDLQAALIRSNPGDSLFVAAGTYKPTTGTSRAATFNIPAGVLVYGGFAGNEANLAARDLSAGNETILSGDLGTTINTLGDFDDAGYATTPIMS